MMKSPVSVSDSGGGCAFPLSGTRPRSAPWRQTLGVRRILVVEDEPIAYYGLSVMIRDMEDLEVFRQSSNAEETMALLKNGTPDMAIVDVHAGGADGLRLIRRIRRRFRFPILVMSSHDESVWAERVLRAGAQGYVMKNRPVSVLREAISQVLKGNMYLSDAVKSTLLKVAADCRIRKRAASRRVSLGVR